MCLDGVHCKWVSSLDYSGRLWLTTVPGAKSPPADAGDVGDQGSIPGLGRSPGGGHGNPTPCLDLENPMDGGAWQATVREVAKSRIRWSNLTQSALWGRWPPYKDRAGCRSHLRGRKSVSVERVIPSHFTSPVLLLTSCFKYSISVWLHSVILSPDSRWSTLGKFCG